MFSVSHRFRIQDPTFATAPIYLAIYISSMQNQPLQVFVIRWIVSQGNSHLHVYLKLCFSWCDPLENRWWRRLSVILPTRLKLKSSGLGCNIWGLLFINWDVIQVICKLSCQWEVFPAMNQPFHPDPDRTSVQFWKVQVRTLVQNWTLLNVNYGRPRY